MYKLKVVLVSVLFAFSALASTAYAEEENGNDIPLGFPWSAWGEASDASGSDVENGWKIDGYAEQGIDWFQLGDGYINTFAALRFTASEHEEDWWNNKWGPYLGVKWRVSPNCGEDSYCAFNIGYRWEHLDYNDFAPVDTDTRHVVYLQWSAGGNWK